MSHSAFLRVIASEPADDTARLVYADFLEETGEPVQVARAEFIRTQIQAHTLHPNHPRRAELQTRAAELFAANWVEWWSPVCETIGLPVPQFPTGSFRDRVSRFFGREPPRPGHPYRVDGQTTLGVIQTRSGPRTTLRTVAFERGFPQWISLLSQLRDTKDAIRAWTTASPLTALHLSGTVAHDWQLIDGEHLRGVRELSLGSAAATAVTAVAESRNLPRLEELSLRPDRSNLAWPAEQYRAFADSSLATRVRWLRVVIGRLDEAEALAAAPLANLAGLTIEATPAGGEDAEDVARVAEAVSHLLKSPKLPTLRELSVTGAACVIGTELSAGRGAELRRLRLDAGSFGMLAAELIRLDALPELTDLAVTAAGDGILWVCYALVDSALPRQLRHLRLVGPWKPGSLRPPDAEIRAVWLRLVRSLDPEKLETLTLDWAVRDMPEVWDEFQERFPGRVSLV